MIRPRRVFEVTTGILALIVAVVVLIAALYLSGAFITLVVSGLRGDWC